MLVLESTQCTSYSTNVLFMMGQFSLSRVLASCKIVVFIYLFTITSVSILILILVDVPIGPINLGGMPAGFGIWFSLFLAWLVLLVYGPSNKTITKRNTGRKIPMLRFSTVATKIFFT